MIWDLLDFCVTHNREQFRIRTIAQWPRKKGHKAEKEKNGKKTKKKFRRRLPSNVVLSLGILVDTTCQPRDGWPAPTNLVWTWISITCWVVKSSLVKLGVMVCDKRHITSTPLWTPGRSSHTWLGGTGKTPAVQVFWSIFPINFTKQKKTWAIYYLSLLFLMKWTQENHQ